VIGGPPCKSHSSLAAIVRARYGDDAVAENLIPEFERCTAEANPKWFLMENTPRAPIPIIQGYAISSCILNNRYFGSPQNRRRRFSFGAFGDTPIDLLRYIEIVLFEHPRYEYAVLAGHQGAGAKFRFGGRRKDGSSSQHTPGTLAKLNRVQKRTVADNLELQGLPRDLLDHAPFTETGKREIIGNGVPLPMGRAIAKAIKAALEDGLNETRP